MADYYRLPCGVDSGHVTSISHWVWPGAAVAVVVAMSWLGGSDSAVPWLNSVVDTSYPCITSLSLSSLSVSLEFGDAAVAQMVHAARARLSRVVSQVRVCDT